PVRMPLHADMYQTLRGVLQDFPSCFEHGNALADFKGSYTLLGHAKSAITTCLERINSAWRSAGS
ncbi:hypothetical protein, partial [Stenotrophomonas maltophilia]|uniref:hypothetical protein n=1 Tax=Stenotrophomonas maltophilia TaxID=40324 RepID=UPI003D18E019